MKGQHVMEQGLRDWLRDQESTPTYLAEVFSTTAKTRQRGPSIVARLVDGLAERFPGPSTRAMRVALIGLVLAALLGTLVVVGAIVFDRMQRSVVINPDQPSQPPSVNVSSNQLREIIRAGYGRMPELPPLVLTATIDGTGRQRISVSQTGSVRIERYESLDGGEPTEVVVYAGESIGQLYHFHDRTLWYGGFGISEDPRVFVYAALSSAGFGSSDEEVCPGGTVGVEGFASSLWTYEGREEVIGRAVDHVACEGRHFWIDVETALVLRSRGPTTGIDGRPTGEVSEIEVVDLDFTIPPENLFVMAPPDGVATATDEEYQKHQCFISGRCLVTPRPIPTPPPADVSPPELTAAQLVKRAIAAAGPDVPYLVRTTSDSSGQNRLPDATRVVFDGVDRVRTESTNQVGSIWESTWTSVVRGGNRYRAEPQPDGSETWSVGPLEPGETVEPWPLQVWDVACGSNWTLAGTDLVAGRVADHVVCSGDDRTELWIDREVTVLLRIHTPDAMTTGENFQQVDELTLGPVDPTWFDVPEDVLVDDQ